MKKIRYILIVAASLMLGSCASIVNLQNNKSWRMGIDVITESPEPISVTVNGKEAKYYRLYESGTYYVDRVILKHPKQDFQISISQNGVTKTGKVHGEKTKGLFWFTGLWVLVDHAKGTLRQYPALVFEDMEQQSAGK
jgi:hypothetical protein